MKKEILNYCKYRSIFYFFIVAFCTIFFGIIYEIKSNPTYDQTIFVFVSEEIDYSSLENTINKNYEGTNIKKVSFDTTNANNLNYNLIFQTRGITNTDLVIIEPSMIKSGSYGKYFSVINENSILEALSKEDLNFYYDNGICYGISVKEYLNSSSDLYLFFNAKSEKNYYATNKGNNDSLIALKCILEDK